MNRDTWPKGQQQVFEAFRQVLPEGDELRRIGSEIGRSSRRDGARRDEFFDEYGEAAAQLLGGDAEALLSAYFTRPAERPFEARYDDPDRTIECIAAVLAGVWCERHPSAATAAALCDRVTRILSDPTGAVEITSGWDHSARDYARNYLFPKVGICLRVLIQHLEIDGVQDFLQAVFGGQYNQRLDRGEDAWRRFEDTSAELIGYEPDCFHQLLQRLVARNACDYAWFERALAIFANCTRTYWAFPDPADAEDETFTASGPAFTDCYRDYLSRYIRARAIALPESAENLEQLIDYSHFAGIAWLQLGLEQIRRLGLKAKALKDGRTGNCIRTLIASAGLAPGETESDLIGMLQGFKEAELLVALPYAGAARPAILKALGWEALLPLQQLIFQIGRSHQGTRDGLTDIYNCESTNSGVIDRIQMAEALAPVADKLLSKYLKALRASSLELGNILMLVAAVRGIERDKIEKKLVRHGQAAIKAYGLYAVESDAELRARYLKFKAMHKEATQYGAERQANTQAAVKAGIKNLAQSAGYSDDIRLEWAMEADIAGDMIPFDELFEVEDWQVQLVLEGISPRIRVYKQGKPLKSVPPKVRKTDVYQQMRAAQDGIRAQASRFRKTLEDMMCAGDAIAADELGTLSRLPVVRAMLAQLVLKTGAEGLGLFTGSCTELCGLDGQPVAIVDDPVIAHVHDLYSAGCLSAWQKAVVQRRMVQPFKQVFRELYVVTPAEVEAGTHSRRFVGHVIDGSTASRLLQGRAWSQNSGDCAEVYKRFPGLGYYAEIGFPDAGHYLAEMGTVTVDEIWFQGQGGPQPLASIEPRVFSEVMRDVDLIVSVAQVDDEDARWSTETAQRRAELIENLMADIGLARVRCEDHFAYIEGSLAHYRIHLGSGVIHIQPGNYLCIVPEQKKDEGLYLPFADADLKMAEIISKIFMLLADDQINDDSILAQIRGAGD